MRIDAATPTAVRIVAEQMRERDEAEFLAVSHAASRDELVQALVGTYGPRNDLIMASDDTGPIAIGGLIEHRPNVATLLFFATDGFQSIALGLTRFIRCNLFPKVISAGAHRIECVSIDGYTETHRWIELLGLKREAVFKGYGKGGENFVQFAWVAGGDDGPV